MANSSMLTGKSVVVTGMSPTFHSPNLHSLTFRPGGASGIGLALVRFFASYACKVALLDISEAAAQSVLLSLRTEFPSATFMFQKCDVSNWDEQKAAFEKLYEQTGSIDIVCANAGIVEAGKFFGVDEEPKKPNLKTLDIDLNGTLYCKSLVSSLIR
jgi:NAD(P)-dependent dehydrogenase (short-subunit alcohol dehydrogenase family)